MTKQANFFRRNFFSSRAKRVDSADDTKYEGMQQITDLIVSTSAASQALDIAWTNPAGNPPSARVAIYLSTSPSGPFGLATEIGGGHQPPPLASAESETILNLSGSTLYYVRASIYDPVEGPDVEDSILTTT